LVWLLSRFAARFVRQLEPQQLCRDAQDPRPAGEAADVLAGGAGFDAAQVGLGDAHPPGHDLLGERRSVVGVGAVGGGDAAHVAGLECVGKLG
jgi:hypothetical protein